MLFPPERPDWERDGRDWPNREHSRFVAAGGLRWHVQLAGEGPAVLLLHGTGASTHTWRDMLPLLAREMTVIAPDLPGQGFSEPLPFHRLTLGGMAAAMADLLRRLEVAPAMIVGHSAGAAIAVRMALDGRVRPDLLVSLNGALVGFDGVAGHLFPSLAKLLFVNPLTPRLFAMRAEEPRVRRMLAETGSTIGARGEELYLRLFRKPGHVAGALGMMAGWDLHGLERALPGLRCPLTLVTTRDDRMIPPEKARRAAGRVPGATLLVRESGGHLVHEERPEAIVTLLLETARETGILPGETAPPVANGGPS
ncbi:alpha/beta fold hydrolase BchO [Caenispirillum salinarum]|uniref:alpha/beta fold hydrolase BchO n=1 Tax=Caenispirillum salinarum TaxID=859058 RepID=UPI00384F8F35